MSYKHRQQCTNEVKLFFYLVPPYQPIPYVNGLSPNFAKLMINDEKLQEEVEVTMGQASILIIV